MKFNNIYETRIGCHNSQLVFSYLMETLKETITRWDYFVNWAKVFDNVDAVEMDLNTLNYLIGKDDIEKAFATLLKQHPRIARLIPILIACRRSKFKVLHSYDASEFKYETYVFGSSERIDIPKVVEFAKCVGFLDILRRKRIKSIVDYVIGVEVGLDSNARKNRGGESMEKVVEFFVKNICDRKGFTYIPQATAKKVATRWGTDLGVDRTSRKVDFIVNNGKQLFLIETNFYGGGGSKLKSTAGEYMTMNDFWKSAGHEFIWITDGPGWITTRRSLEEAFSHIDHILNLEMVSKGLLEDIMAEVAE